MKDTIDYFIDDLSVRELQIESSVALSLSNATNTFIKQFKADHDSHQFYKNVIKWFMLEYKCMPTEYVQS